MRRAKVVSDRKVEVGSNHVDDARATYRWSVNPVRWDKSSSSPSEGMVSPVELDDGARAIKADSAQSARTRRDQRGLDEISAVSTRSAQSRQRTRRDQSALTG